MSDERKSQTASNHKNGSTKICISGKGLSWLVEKAGFLPLLLMRWIWVSDRVGEVLEGHERTKTITARRRWKPSDAARDECVMPLQA